MPLTKAWPKAETSRIPSQLVQGRFPEGFEFAHNTFGGIHICNMLHFLRGDEIIEGLKKCLQWLQPGGKIYLIVCSINFPIMEAFLPIYKRNKAQGAPFPGEVHDIDTYVPTANQRYTPRDNFFHVFSDEDIAKLLKIAGFTHIETCNFGLSNVKYQSEKGAWVGAIASKPL